VIEIGSKTQTVTLMTVVMETIIHGVATISIVMVVVVVAILFAKL